MADDGSRFRYLGTGAALAMEVTGPTVESCLARAVEGLGNAVAIVHPSVACRTVAVAVHAPGRSPAALLRAVLEAAADRLANHGEVPLALDGVVRDGATVRARLEVAPLSAARPPSPARAPTWHGVDLHRNGQGWHGVVVADL
ncbi:MAG TPA: archease [Acidimicrobiales bacterium]|jgi:SHS2 domain-containing protein